MFGLALSNSTNNWEKQLQTSYDGITKLLLLTVERSYKLILRPTAHKQYFDLKKRHFVEAGGMQVYWYIFKLPTSKKCLSFIKILLV